MKDGKRKMKAAASSALAGLLLLQAFPAFGETLAESGTSPGSLAAQEATIHGGTLVVITYFVLFGLLGGYMFWLMRRQQRLQKEIDALDEKIDGMLQG